MTTTELELRTVTVEREFPYPAEKLWRALTQPHLIEAWLMKSDFQPLAGHAFRFTADWGSVDCEVKEVDPFKVLSYTWAAHGLESVVTWILNPTKGGTSLKMEQFGFRQDQEQAFQGAKYGWNNFFNSLEQILSKEAV